MVRDPMSSPTTVRRSSSPVRRHLACLLALMLIPSAAHASAPIAAKIAAAIPSEDGTGLAARWVVGANLQTIADARALLGGATGTTTIVGPVNLTNDWMPLGDFAGQTLMPYSPGSTPSGNGLQMAATITGAWAARAPGTYTLLVGSDDGSELELSGTSAIAMLGAQSFRRSACVVQVESAGLVPITITYFNGRQAAALELAVANGAVDVTNPSAAPPAAFALIPRRDLYPISALGSADAGVASDAGGDPRDGSAALDVDAAADAGTAPVGAGSSKGDASVNGPGKEIAEDGAVGFVPLSAGQATDVAPLDAVTASPSAADAPTYQGDGCEASPLPAGRPLASFVMLGVVLSAWRVRRARKERRSWVGQR